MPLPKFFTTVTTFSKVLALVLFVLFPVFGFYLGMQYQQLQTSSQAYLGVYTASVDKPTCSVSEKQKINLWIKENDLNEYGDNKSTVYIGGTPLFNEATDESIDLYEYLLDKHPDRPWNTQ